MKYLTPILSLEADVNSITNEFYKLLPPECSTDLDLLKLIDLKHIFTDAIKKLKAEESLTSHPTLEIVETKRTFKFSDKDSRIIIDYSPLFKTFNVTRIKVSVDSTIVEDSINHLKSLL